MEGKMQHTLAMIKPDAVGRSDEIEKIILNNDFTIVEKKETRLSQKEAEEFYKEHEGKPFYENLVQYMSSGKIVAMILSKVNSIAEWRSLLGPTKVSVALNEAPNSIRAIFGSRVDDSCNAAHGSDSEESAEREIQFFFPNLTLESILERGSAKDYLSSSVSPVLVEGLSELCKLKPKDPVVWLADWLLLHNPSQKVVQQ